ncbi:MAG: hypothetical protein Tsb0034_16390 [Ekhidna sp.]
MINRNRIFLLLTLSVCTVSFGQKRYDELTEQVSFNSTDDVTIYADLALQDPEATTIILFHQGGSNVRGEYRYTLPVLYDMGYNILASDLRSGGDLFDQSNRTVSNLPSDLEVTYCDAESDVQAAIDYATTQGLQKFVLVGSSYTASLVIRVGAQNKDKVAGIIALSPSSGGPMAPCRPDEIMDGLEVPLLIVRPRREMEIESVRQQFELAKSFGHQTYIAENGVHGSSSLDPSRVEGGVEQHWEVVKRFLGTL